MTAGAAISGGVAPAAATAQPQGKPATGSEEAPADAFAALLDRLAAVPGVAPATSGEAAAAPAGATLATEEAENAEGLPLAVPTELPAWLVAAAGLAPAAQTTSADPAKGPLGASAALAALRAGPGGEVPAHLASTDTPAGNAGEPGPAELPDLLAQAPGAAPATATPPSFASLMAQAGAAAATAGAAGGSQESESLRNSAAADALAAPGFHAQAHAAANPSSASTNAAPVHQAALPSHPLDTAFAGDLGAEVHWMVEAGVQQAELHLNPADLGPIRIQLSITAQTADISFAAAHATTREGISQALPSLREMLAGQGLQLGQAGVGAGSDGSAYAQAQPQPQPDTARAARAGATSTGDTLGLASTRGTHSVVLRAGRGMLDLYA